MAIFAITFIFVNSVPAVMAWSQHPLCTPGEPCITWASQPVAGNQTVLLMGEGLDSGMIMMRQGGDRWMQASRPVNASTRYGTAAVVPTSFALAPFEVRIGTNASPIWINAPDPWFIFGDKGDTATPGGWARIVGNSVGLAGARNTVLKLSSHSGPPLKIMASSRSGNGQTTRWHAYFDLPPNMLPGTYNASISSSPSGMDSLLFVPLCTFISTDTICLSTLTVQSQAPPKGKVFNVVKHFGSPQPGVGRNATLAVQAAIAAAAQAGPGSVVYFPRGTYFVYGPLLVPQGVTLKGASAKLSSIYFQEQNYTDTPGCRSCTTAAPDAYITGASNVTSWAAEDLTLYVTAFYRNVIRVAPNSDGVSLRRLVVRANSYFCLEVREGTGSRGRSTWWDYYGSDRGSRSNAMLLAGKNIFIEDNDLYSTGDVLSTLNNGDAGASYMHIRGNRIFNGGTAHWGISWKQTIFEDNIMQGVSPTAMGSNYAQYSHDNGNPHVQNVYHNNNSMSMVWGNDREMMTLDGGGGVYYGHVKPSTRGATSIVLLKSAQAAQPGGALVVLNGTGTGQYRRIVGSTSSNTVWELESPFDVSLDASSIVTIIPWVGHLMWTNNHYSDGGAIQLYATGLEIVLADSHFARTGGMIPGWGLQEETSSAYNPTFHNQALDNVIEEGNHVWNYADTDYDKGHPAHNTVPYKGTRIEPWWFASLCFGPANVSLSRFIVFRGNRIENNGGINIQGLSANLLLEGNMVLNSDVGIHVNHSTVMGGIVVRGNIEPPEIAGKNFDPYSDRLPEVKEVTHNDMNFI